MAHSTLAACLTRYPARLMTGILGAALVVSITACDLPGTSGSTAPSPTPSPTIVYQNPLTSLASGWDNKAGSCFFGAGGYHIKANYACYAPVDAVTDVDVSVRANQISGPLTSPYGIIVRRTSTVSYEFDIIGTGEWQFVRCFSGTCTALVAPTRNAAITSGLKKVKTIEVRAVRKHFDFYVNATKVGQADDTLVVSGSVGLAVSKNMECVFSHLTITKLS